MNPSVISALSAVLGSIVGGGASIATAWFTQRAQSRRETIHDEVRKRELLYGEFISECSKLIIDAFDHELDNPSALVQVYGLVNRIRLVSSDAVVEAAQNALEVIIDRYFQTKMTFLEFRKNREHLELDPLQNFSTACREELRELTRLA